MNDILEVIKGRRSVRKFKPDAIGEEKLKKILTAGQWAPSFMNTQPWKFIVISNSEVKRRLIEALHMPFLGVTYKGQLPYTDLLEAPTIIAICADTARDKLHYIEDAAMATLNMALEAHSIGLGSYLIGIFNHTYVEDAAKKILNIPDSFRVIALMPLGVPAETPKKGRESLDNLVYYNSFGNKTP
jgi:nitroreductase